MFFFNETATTEIYTLTQHDALPIFLRTTPAVERCGVDPVDPGIERGPHRLDRVLRILRAPPQRPLDPGPQRRGAKAHPAAQADRKSTRLNSSHANISYAVFCLNKTT